MKAAPVIRLECPSLVFSTAFHPSQELIACSTVLGQISLHNLSSKTASLFSHHQDSCRTLAFSPGGSAIFSGSSDGSLHMTDINGKLILRRKLAHDDSINIVKCLDENLVATGCDGGTVRVWDIRTRKRICEYSATDYISDLHFVPDSKILLSTSGDGSLCAFELRKKIPVFSAHQDVRNNKKICIGTSSGTLLLFTYGQWGDCTDRFTGHSENITCIINRDDDSIYTASEGVIKSMNILPNKFIGTVAETDAEQMALSADGMMIATCGHDEFVNVWSSACDDAQEEGGSEEDSDDSDDSDDSQDKPKQTKKRKVAPKKKVASNSFFKDMD